MEACLFQRLGDVGAWLARHAVIAPAMNQAVAFAATDASGHLPETVGGRRLPVLDGARVLLWRNRIGEARAIVGNGCSVTCPLEAYSEALARFPSKVPEPWCWGAEAESFLAGGNRGAATSAAAKGLEKFRSGQQSDAWSTERALLTFDALFACEMYDDASKCAAVARRVAGPAGQLYMQALLFDVGVAPWTTLERTLKSHYQYPWFGTALQLSRFSAGLVRPDLGATIRHWALERAGGVDVWTLNETLDAWRLSSVMGWDDLGARLRGACPLPTATTIAESGRDAVYRFLPIAVARRDWSSVGLLSSLGVLPPSVWAEALRGPEGFPTECVTLAAAVHGPLESLGLAVCIRAYEVATRGGAMWGALAKRPAVQLY